MRDPTINVEVEEAIAAAVRVLEGRKVVSEKSLLGGPARSRQRATKRAAGWWRQSPMLPPRFAPPPGAEELILRRLTGPEPRPRRRRGRYAEGGWKIRDRIIVTAIEFAVKRGFKPTRNRRAATPTMQYENPPPASYAPPWSRIGAHICLKAHDPGHLAASRPVRAYSPNRLFDSHSSLVPTWRDFSPRLELPPCLNLPYPQTRAASAESRTVWRINKNG